MNGKTLMDIEGRKARLVGSGIANLAAAAYLIKDGGFSGANISIYEVEDWAEIRRPHRAEGLPIKVIARGHCQLEVVWAFGKPHKPHTSHATC